MSIRRPFALLLIVTISAAFSPLFAADPADSKFVLPKPVPFGLMHNYVPYAPQQAVPPATPPPSQKKQLTTAGKVMKWVGIGLMADGGASIGIGAAGGFSACATNSYASACSSLGSGFWYGVGGAEVGVGALLFFLGIHKTE